MRSLTRAAVAGVLFVVCALPVVLPAQRGVAGPAQGPFGGGGVGRGGAPPRDNNAAQPAGTAIIRGRVLVADTGAPVRRAQVRATSADARAGRLASTDAQGRFELKDLPAGRWTLTASKAGFVTLQYGQRRPLETGRAIEIRDGEALERVDISLPRGSAVTGHIYDEFGEPVANARVQVLRYQMVQGARRLVPVGGGDQTDDTGAFRVFGLAPGEYFVSATLRAGVGGFGGPPGAGGDTSDGLNYAPTYFPGTGSLAEAQRLTLGVAQEQGNINFALLPVKTVHVSGVALTAGGERLAGGVVSLTPSGDSASAFGLGGNTTRVRNDGTFTLTNVVPGAYTLSAATGGGGGRRGGGADAELASMPLSVGADDLNGITVVTGRGATLTGTIMAAEGSTGELRTSGLQVLAQAVRPEFAGPFGGNNNARVNDDASFTLNGLSGQRVLRVNGLSQEWMVKAIMLDATDITDTPLDFRSGEAIAGVRVIVTDKVTVLSGTVTSRGQPARDYSLVVFPEDTTKWTYPSRFVRTARPDQQGQFSLRGLPGGERYLVVAIDYLEDGEGADPQFLTAVRDRATRVTLAEGESKALTLSLTTR